MKFIIIIIIFTCKYIQADPMSLPPPHFPHKYGGYANSEPHYLHSPNTFLVRQHPQLQGINFGSDYIEGALHQPLLPPHHLDGINIPTVASIVNSGSVDDGENGIDRNRIGAFLDKMSPRNSPIGFERPQAPTTIPHNWEEVERQPPPLHLRGRNDNPNRINGNWAMATSGENERKFSNRFDKIFISFFSLITILLLNI
uniref:Uncharacterized protein n=2 Tax=Meloidogyne TaxID=189290 RepID=A0A6V7W114_MELEN|nr:unnamed protein product [Meloidogyne enterolobii]